MERFEASVFGRVQGVFFRDSTRREAQRLGAEGWVRNERDGSVRVVAEGTREVLEALAQYLSSGPPAARVERVELAWQQATGEFRGFRIRP